MSAPDGFQKSGTRARIGATLRGAAVAAGLIVLAGCQADELGYGPKAERPLPHALKTEMTAKNMKPSDPILVRLFKQESKLEVWKRTSSGRYALLKEYDICKWSGKLGPKKKEGDRQAPEGFYTIRPAQMNPNSSYHLSFNTGFPNAYDRALGRTGSNLMVHGACSSRGCYAMTDEQIQEIYALAREAFRGGQRDFQLEAFPFRMTAENMARHADNENLPFWRMLKRGYDHFEVTRIPPKVDVCDRRYIFDAQPESSGARFLATQSCPAYQVPEKVQMAVAAKEKADDARMEMIVAKLEKKREREEEWKNGDTAIAKLFGPGNEAGSQPREGTGAQASTLAYAPAGAEPAPGAPVPSPNPERDDAAAPGSERDGFFSSLFTGSTKRGTSPVAPASERPADVPPLPQQAGEANAVPGEPMATSQPGTDPAPLPKERAEESAEKSERSGSKVSRMVSRWFSFGKDKDASAN